MLVSRGYESCGCIPTAKPEFRDMIYCFRSDISDMGY